MANNENLKDIYELMKQHCGKANAISSKKIGEIFKLRAEDTHAEARELIKKIIDEFGLPILGGGRGYYVATSKEELDSYISSLDNRIEKIEERKNMVKSAFQKYYGSIQ